MTKTKIIVAMMVLALFSACNSIPKPEEVPDTLTAQDLTLRAQQAFDKGNYQGAIAYYEIMRDRFPENTEVQVQATFEIGHILLTQKKWKKAEEVLTQIISRYEQPGSVLLAKKYYILAQNDLARIAEKK